MAKKKNNKVSIEKMNQTIAKWLFGKGKIVYDKNQLGNPYWILKVGKTEFLPYMTAFNTLGTALMPCLTKIMNQGYWFAVYPTEVGKWVGKGRNKKRVYETKYYYAFTRKTFMSRLWR